jgi:hypothetical protein
VTAVRVVREHGSVAERFAALFPGEQIALVERVDEMARRFDRLANQRPSTCGAFALSYLLPALGFEARDGHDVSAEDYLAHLAAVVIEEREEEPSRAVEEQVARGELSAAEALDRFGRIWYRYPVRASADPVAQGTSPTGIARAVALASGGRLASLPVPGRDERGVVALDPPRWEALFDLLAEQLAGWSIHVIFNYESDQLLDPRSAEYRPERLREPGSADRLPRDHWGVGHFAGLAGLWRRPNGDRWLLLFDTYKERGFDGYQPQPAELMRRGLVREDGRGGGALIVLPSERVAESAGAIRGLGIEPRMWSNGSPEPDDWHWQLGR